MSQETLGPDQEARLVSLVRSHLPLVWRVLRRLGLSNAEADDTTQHVFLLLARRLQEVEPGRERAFLVGSAVRLAASARRKLARRVEVTGEEWEPTAEVPNPEELVAQRQARALFDAAVEELEADVQACFVLFEVEQMSRTEIAALLELKEGTVASRLRRARRQFEAIVSRRLIRRGGL